MAARPVSLVGGLGQAVTTKRRTGGARCLLLGVATGGVSTGAAGQGDAGRDVLADRLLLGEQVSVTALTISRPCWPFRSQSAARAAGTMWSLPHTTTSTARALMHSSSRTGPGSREALNITSGGTQAGGGSRRRVARDASVDGHVIGSDRDSVNDLADAALEHVPHECDRVRSCGWVWIFATQHVGERNPSSCCCESTYSQLGSGTGAEFGFLAAAAWCSALVTQSSVEHRSHDGPCLEISAAWCREVMAGTNHRLGASGASVSARPRVPLERDAAGRTHVMQLVGPLGVVTHVVNVPGITTAYETISLSSFMPG